MKTLKYAVRFLLRAKSYTTINLLGLTLSLACCITCPVIFIVKQQ